jgi:hypothetical protein
MQDATRTSQSPAESQSLAELNRRFFDLEWTRARLGRRLAALSDPARTAVADCPYALFDLRFEDGEHWQLQLQNPASWSVADLPPIDFEAADFVRLALFYAWHRVTSARSSARLVFGMHERTADALAASTVSRLALLAPAATRELTVRWGHCERFWSGLVTAAERHDSSRLRRIQLSGIQLGAALQLPLRPEPREV